MKIEVYELVIGTRVSIWQYRGLGSGYNKPSSIRGDTTHRRSRQTVFEIIIMRSVNSRDLLIEFF